MPTVTGSRAFSDPKRATLGKSLLMFVFLFALMACKTVPVEVRYNFDKDADFSKFKTYKWVTLKDAAKIDDVRDKQIKTVVDAELARKGFDKTDADTADLYLAYQAGIETQQQFSSYKSDWGYGSGWAKGGWYSGIGGMVTEQTAVIQVGQLAVDMYDAAHHSLPPAARVGMKLDGTMDLPAVLRSLLANPGQLPALIRTGLEAERGFRALLRGHRRLGPRLGGPDFA